MSTKKYYLLRKIIIPLVCSLVFLAIYFDVALLAVPAILLGKVAITFMKGQLKENLEDERVQDIHEKAARTSFRVLMPILGLTAATLYFVGDGPFYFLKSLGIILGYVTCFGIIVYSAAYYYLDHKYGGR